MCDECPLAAARHPRLRGNDGSLLPYLLLRAELRLAPDLLPEDEDLLLLPLALARSLCALLFWVLALPPWLAACERLILPDDEEDAEGFDEDEEEELRAAMDCSFALG